MYGLVRINGHINEKWTFVSVSIPVTIVSDPEGDTDDVECVELGVTNINLREVIIIIIAIVARNHSNKTVNMTLFCGQL